MRNSLLVFLLAAISFPALAANMTSWLVENKTNTQVSVTCEGAAQGIGQKIVHTMVIAANQTGTISWTEYTNDGMGLNPAAWQCDAKVDSVTGTSTFSTDWGENIVLSIEKPNNENLALTKSTKVAQ